MKENIVKKIPLEHEDVIEVQRVFYLYQSINSLMNTVFSQSHSEEIIEKMLKRHDERFAEFNSKFDKLTSKYSPFKIDGTDIGQYDYNVDFNKEELSIILKNSESNMCCNC